MNKLIKEISRREAGKSEVTVGNIRSILKHFTEIMSLDETDTYISEWNEYAMKTHLRLNKKTKQPNKRSK